MFRWLRRNRQDQLVTDSHAALGRAGLPGYAGDYPQPGSRPLHIEYAPHPDGLADPGEVVWAWVPFEEDYSKGKDRPVLIVGRDGDLLLGLMLTSKDHNRDAAEEATHGRHWLDVGAGGWDGQRRPSEVRLDRILRLHPDGVRREGATLPRPVLTRSAPVCGPYVHNPPDRLVG
ncbi:type II toxin-antitoxin system PemK/MazF family toxin [Jatrophihabitans sp. DSM 45814]